MRTYKTNLSTMNRQGTLKKSGLTPDKKKLSGKSPQP